MLAGEEQLPAERDGLEGAGAAGLELEGGDLVDAEPVGDDVDGAGHQQVGGGGAEDEDVHVGGLQARFGQCAGGGRGGEVGQRVGQRAAFEVEREVAGLGADEDVHPFGPLLALAEPPGQRDVVHGGARERGADRQDADIGDIAGTGECHNRASLLRGRGWVFRPTCLPGPPRGGRDRWQR